MKIWYNVKRKITDESKTHLHVLPSVRPKHRRYAGAFYVGKRRIEKSNCRREADEGSHKRSFFDGEREGEDVPERHGAGGDPL